MYIASPHIEHLHRVNHVPFFEESKQSSFALLEFSSSEHSDLNPLDSRYAFMSLRFCADLHRVEDYLLRVADTSDMLLNCIVSKNESQAQVSSKRFTTKHDSPVLRTCGRFERTFPSVSWRCRGHPLLQ